MRKTGSILSSTTLFALDAAGHKMPLEEKIDKKGKNKNQSVLKVEKCERKKNAHEYESESESSKIPSMSIFFSEREEKFENSKNTFIPLFWMTSKEEKAYNEEQRFIKSL